MMAALPSATVGLGSLVFDFEVEEVASTPCEMLPPARSKEQLSHDKEKIKHFSVPDTSYSAKLLRDVRYFVNEERDPDAILLATKLSAVGYSVNVRTALGGGTSCFRNLRHEFLTVRGNGDFEGVEFIVEPRFREHFIISHPTEEYSELLSHAPDVFVGVGGRLVPIVQTLCDLMAVSFERQGLTLPPWRRTQSMLSKWLPNRARDVPVSFSRGSAPPHRVASSPSQPAPSAASPTAAGGAAGAGVTVSSAGPFARISDPLFVRSSNGTRHHANGTPPPLPKQQQPADGRSGAGAAGHGDEWAYATEGFIPFGGAGGCSSDTEGPSPPAARVIADGPTAHSSAAAAVTCSISRRAGQPNSALSSHFHPHLQQQQQQQPVSGCYTTAGPGQAPPAYHHPQHHPGILPTRPPAHWGEAPIHRVRLGFQVAAAAVAASPPVSEQHRIPPGQSRTHLEPVPERPAPVQP